MLTVTTFPVLTANPFAKRLVLSITLFLQTPPEPERAAPFRPKASLLFTGDDEEAALALSTGMLPAPTLTATTLLQAEHYLEAFAADLKQQPGGLTVPGELLSLLGVRLGTSSAVKAGLYLETALMGVSAKTKLLLAGANSNSCTPGGIPAHSCVSASVVCCMLTTTQHGLCCCPASSFLHLACTHLLLARVVVRMPCCSVVTRSTFGTWHKPTILLMLRCCSLLCTRMLPRFTRCGLMAHVLTWD